jgi:hypothetical protein
MASGHIFPIPRPVESNAGLRLDKQIMLRNAQNELLAVTTLDEICRWELTEIAFV